MMSEGSGNSKKGELAIGTMIAGKYRVERGLGKGGMGVVVAARHIDLDTVFAIKLMHTAGISNRVAVERFLNEARAAVQLKAKTPHIVQVHDVGRLPSGEPFIVMELLEGEDLGAILKRRGTIHIHEACRYVYEATLALAEAHALGIIHRDLKPGNLFLTHQEGGVPILKILDFGIAKHLFRKQLPDGEIDLTGAHDILGSPLYMAPEQMSSARAVDIRCDLWSLGAILYKLLTGRAPFQADAAAEIFFSTLDPAPATPPIALRPDLPQDLNAVIMRCLEKNLALRYRSAHELLHALYPFLAMGPAGDEDALTIRLDAKPAARALRNVTLPMPKVTNGEAQAPLSGSPRSTIRMSHATPQALAASVAPNVFPPEPKSAFFPPPAPPEPHNTRTPSMTAPLPPVPPSLPPAPPSSLARALSAIKADEQASLGGVDLTMKPLLSAISERLQARYTLIAVAALLALAVLFLAWRLFGPGTQSIARDNVGAPSASPATEIVDPPPSASIAAEPPPAPQPTALEAPPIASSQSALPMAQKPKPAQVIPTAKKAAAQEEKKQPSKSLRDLKSW